MQRSWSWPVAVLVLVCVSAPAARAIEGRSAGWGWCPHCGNVRLPHDCPARSRGSGGSGGSGGAASPKAALVNALIQGLLSSGDSEAAAARQAELERRRAEEARREAKRLGRQAAKERARWDAEDEDLEGLVDAMSDTWDGGGGADSLADVMSDADVVDLRPDKMGEPSPEVLARAEEEAQELAQALEQMILECKDPEEFLRKLDELELELLEELKKQSEMLMQELGKVQAGKATAHNDPNVVDLRDRTSDAPALLRGPEPAGGPISGPVEGQAEKPPGTAHNDPNVVDLRDRTSDAPALLREPEPAGGPISGPVEGQATEPPATAEGETRALGEAKSRLTRAQDTATRKLKESIDLLKSYTEVPKEVFLEKAAGRLANATLGRITPHAGRLIHLAKQAYVIPRDTLRDHAVDVARANVSLGGEGVQEVTEADEQFTKSKGIGLLRGIW